MTVIGGSLETIDRKLALRFLSCGKTLPAVSEELEALLTECERLVLRAQSLKCAYDFYPVTHGEKLDLGFVSVESRDLAKSLNGCNRIILFAATAGIEIDRLILRFEKIAPAKAAAVQALGAALVERWCDEVCDLFRRKYNANRFRYSCGFGDLPLTLQRDIFAALKLEKNLGMSLSESCIMTPSKSVTAIVGIKEHDHH